MLLSSAPPGGKGGERAAEGGFLCEGKPRKMACHAMTWPDGGRNGRKESEGLDHAASLCSLLGLHRQSGFAGHRAVVGCYSLGFWAVVLLAGHGGRCC